MKINTILPQEHIFTQIISDIASCPKKLYYLGSLPESRITSVAIIGTRKPTAYGKEVTYKLAYELAQKGIIIISGMAIGIDAIAQKAALDAGGTTIAVLGSGVDQLYPATNRYLAMRIIEKGTIISEYKPGTPPMQHRFLERNRIVSGLSNAIIVTEAATRSGTMSTVNHALDQNKEVFVVPGNITSPMSAGCNRLIKQGAHPITCVEDIIESVAPDLLESQAILPLGNTPLESKIIELLQSGIRDGDKLQESSGSNVTDFSQTMTLMEINSIIRPLGGNQWTLR